MSKDKLIIKGARQHNLKNVNLEIPRDQLIVFTGLSGSGKSSLAFDTIYAEGQRRYVESLSAYARQFLGQMDKPDVDYIEGLSPAICIDQKTASHNPRSTVGTVTEIYDYLRLLFARVGRPHCPGCSRPIAQQTVDQMVDRILALPEGARVQVLAPVVRGRKGEHQKVMDDVRRAGFVRVRVDGEVLEITEDIKLDKNKKHSVEIVVDRLVVRDGIRSRLADSLEVALRWGEGLAVVNVLGDPGEDILFSQKLACPDCGFSLGEIAPRVFSFNSPYGACPKCSGIGVMKEVDPDLVIPDRRLSIVKGAVAPFAGGGNGKQGRGNYYGQLIEAAARHHGFDPFAPVEEGGEALLDLILYGDPEPMPFKYQGAYGFVREKYVRFEGAIHILERKYRESTVDWVREEIEEYMSAIPCPACAGRRLRPESLAVRIGEGGKNIAEVTALPVDEALDYFGGLHLEGKEGVISAPILKEINARLGFLNNVGLGYLTLDRAASTLSGGEAQRIRLATQIGSGLVGVLYILDEPSIGLHQRDNARLIATLERLRDQGNTVIVVEHDEDTIRAADFVVDIGPGAGEYGGRVVAAGPLGEVLASEDSVTAQYLSGRKRIEVPSRRPVTGRRLEIKGAREHNLKGIDVAIPLGLFVCVTGVSGSGKSTLITEILYRRLAQELNRSKVKPGRHDAILGVENLRRVIEIDQSPIGRTPRSNPVTYTGVFDHIREVFAMTPEAKARGYKRGRFSFNLSGGRCEACRGDGIIKIEMHFLPDVYVPCEVCGGKRYNRETLEITYKGKTIADILEMNVDQGVQFFENIPSVKRKLQVLKDVGLGYIRLGQPATQLSGGEAQRVKLATELSRQGDSGALYILDEPTTGLHMADVHRLLEVLQRLVDAGATVVVIEHNLDVIKCADWIIDLGPEGGDGGGWVVAAGTPEQVATVDGSHTGRFLRRVLDGLFERNQKIRNSENLLSSTKPVPL